MDLNAPFIVSKAVIPSMIKKGHGKIINICSMMSELGRETVSAYAAAKGGLNALKNLSAPFGGVKFMPTGGVNVQNVGEFIRAPLHPRRGRQLGLPQGSDRRG